MSTELYIVGDSNVIAICQAADERKIVWKGGPFGAGRTLETKFWQVENGRFILDVQGAAPIRNRFLDLLAFEGPILSTVGFNSNRFAIAYNSYAAKLGFDPLTALSHAAFVDTVLDARRAPIEFYKLLIEHDRDVFFTCSPQRATEGLYPIFKAFEDVLIGRLIEIGAQLVETRDRVMDGEKMLPEFCSDRDQWHGNEKLGALVLKRLIEKQSK